MEFKKLYSDVINFANRLEDFDKKEKEYEGKLAQISKSLVLPVDVEYRKEAHFYTTKINDRSYEGDSLTDLIKLIEKEKADNSDISYIYNIKVI